MKQATYTRKVLQKASLLECNPVKYPTEERWQLHKDEVWKRVDPTQFKSAIRGLRYIMHTRLDIVFVVGIVRRYMERPTVLPYNVMKRILSGFLEMIWEGHKKFEEYERHGVLS